MDTNTTSHPTAAAVPAPDAAVAVFTVGPTITVLALAILARGGVWLSPALLVPVAIGVLVGLWGPHPASLASLWTQSARDRVAAGRHWTVRAAAMLPQLLAGPATRAVTVAQLVGWAGAGVALALAG